MLVAKIAICMQNRGLYVLKSYRSSFLNSDGCQSVTRKLVAFSNAASKTGLAAARMIAWASIFYQKLICHKEKIQFFQPFTSMCSPLPTTKTQSVSLDSFNM
jgi:hypothetical protein